MNVENMKDLAKVRYERAVELAEEAKDLLDKICKYLKAEGVL